MAGGGGDGNSSGKDGLTAEVRAKVSKISVRDRSNPRATLRVGIAT